VKNPMPKHPMTKAALNRALADIHPDPEVARELIGLGIYRVRIDGRLHNGVCGAWAKSRNRSCQRKALENGRCPNHGGMSTGPTTPGGEGALACRREGLIWMRWRLENGMPAQSWRERRAEARRPRLNSTKAEN
jgi:hypothetical protein